MYLYASANAVCNHARIPYSVPPLSQYEHNMQPHPYTQFSTTCIPSQAQYTTAPMPNAALNISCTYLDRLPCRVWVAMC